MSPTPLDPFELTVLGGMSYSTAARAFMESRVVENAGEAWDTHEGIIMNAQQEIDYQHRHRMEKNNEAMAKWREIAATAGNNRMVSRSEAEGIMQVRAGIAQPAAIIELLARNPDMGGIEIAKATRPFCFNAFTMAKRALYSKISELNKNSRHTVELDESPNPRPYRKEIIPEHTSLITKSVLGHVAVDGVELEIITRDSGIISHPSIIEPLPESQRIPFGPHEIDVSLIDTTSYVRAKR